MGVGVKGVYLGRDDEIVSLPAKLLDGLAHDLFGLTLRVHLGTVKEVDTDVVGGFHAGEGAFSVDMTAVCQPATEGDGRNLETGAAQEAVFHLGEISRR